VDDVHLRLLHEKGFRYRVSGVSGGSSMFMIIMATRTVTSVNSLLISDATGCCQFRLKTLYFFISSLEKRIFGFDDGIFRLEKGVQFRLKTLYFSILSLEQRIFGFDEGIFRLEKEFLQMQFNIFCLKSVHVQR